MIRWICLALALVYLWLYPSILLVPDEYRTSFWSTELNVPRRGLIVERQVYEVQSWFKNNTLHRIGVMTNGAKEYFWAANADISAKIQAGDLVAFETRGKVIVLAEPVSTPYISLALLNN